jgi:hypothetical protein
VVNTFQNRHAPTRADSGGLVRDARWAAFWRAVVDAVFAYALALAYALDAERARRDLPYALVAPCRGESC